MAEAWARQPSGYVYRRDGERGAVWHVKYRLPDGRQRKKKIGPAWGERGRPPTGYFTKRTAEAWLRDRLDEARRGTLPELADTQATFADASAEFLRFVEQDRDLKPSTLRGYRSIVDAHLDPQFGETRLTDITPRSIEGWRSSLCAADDGKPLSNASKNRILVLMNGIFERARKVNNLPRNPLSEIERHPERSSNDIDVFTVDEVRRLVKAAASKQDAALYLTAAFTGLRRGELIALRWREIDIDNSVIRVRASYAARTVTVPKSGKVRSVPLAPEVAAALTKLRKRRHWKSDDDLVFVGLAGEYLDGSALRRRYLAALDKAGLRHFRFHDLRHTFGTRMIASADVRRVQEWLGHADIQTTMKYLHYVPRDSDAALVAEAFS